MPNVYPRTAVFGDYINDELLPSDIAAGVRLGQNVVAPPVARPRVGPRQQKGLDGAVVAPVGGQVTRGVP